MEYQKCPVCNGNGQVSGGFYTHPGDCPYWTAGQAMEPCRTCRGRGIIAEPEPEERELEGEGEMAKAVTCPVCQGAGKVCIPPPAGSTS